MPPLLSYKFLIRQVFIRHTDIMMIIMLTEEANKAFVVLISRPLTGSEMGRRMFLIEDDGDDLKQKKIFRALFKIKEDETTAGSGYTSPKPGAKRFDD